jgi:hypothetical protein
MVAWDFETMKNQQTGCDVKFMNTSEAVLTASYSVRCFVGVEREDGAGPILQTCSARKMLLYRV